MKISFALLVQFILLGGVVLAQDEVTPQDIFNVEYTAPQQFSPDGKQLIYVVSKQRGANEPAGPAHVSYYVMDLATFKSAPIVPDSVKISSPRWTPDGKYITFLHKENKKAEAQVWLVKKQDEWQKITEVPGGVVAYSWNPNGKQLAYVTKQPLSEKEKELKKRGYDFVYFEENIKNNQLYLAEFSDNFTIKSTKQISNDAQVWDFEFDTEGTQIAFSVSERNLIDEKYMFRKIHIHNLETGSEIVVKGREGKLGNYVFSPDGKSLAMTSAKNINDHSSSQVLVFNTELGTLTNHTPKNFKGHMGHVYWKNNKTLLVHSAEGVYNSLITLPLNGKEGKVVLSGEASALDFSAPITNTDATTIAFTASTPTGAFNVYMQTEKDEKPVQLTQLNTHLSAKKMGNQKVFSFNASDGQAIEGILIEPVGYEKSKKYPLLVYVHGGPESHHTNGWLSGYSIPAQVMAGKGYLIAFINYRSSTGYGLPFAEAGFQDPAGTEFNDIADGIDYLIAKHGADKDRVGMAGGSYGGYASAWFATYYTAKVNAVCMFVGISDLISKRGTTDIPYEEMYVHSGKPLEEQWQMNLERSPIYWAHQSKTATLIYGGAADPRVHPTQSIELFRRMKMNNHPAVRLVQYPGEGHGNRKQVGRIDVLYRQMAWFDWYVKDNKPISGPMPPLDISEKYGINWELK